MRKKIGLVVILLAALVAAWWWHGRGGARRGGASSSSSSSASASAKAARAGRLITHPARVDGSVRDDKGQPIAGAVVQAATKDGEPIAVVARADGTFTFEQLAPGGYALIAAAPEHLPSRRELELHADERATVDLVLAAGGLALGGIVADTAGGPIEGALLIAVRTRDDDRDDDDDQRARASGAAFSAADGRYALSLAPGDYRIVVTHPEYVGAAAAVALATVGATVDFTLLPGGTIEGVVKDLATGAPVADARVAILRADYQAWTGVGSDRVRAGADGAFRITGVAPGAMTLLASDEADAREAVNPRQLQLGLGDQVVGVELWVQPAAYLEGHVVDEAGSPVGEGWVRVVCMRQYADAQPARWGDFRAPHATAGADGRRPATRRAAGPASIGPPTRGRKVHGPHVVPLERIQPRWTNRRPDRDAALPLVHEPVLPEDPPDGALGRGRQRRLSSSQHRANLLRSPRRVLAPEPDDHLLHVAAELRGRRVWTTRLVEQPAQPARAEATEPLVPGLAADAEIATQLCERLLLAERSNNELFS